MAELVYPELSYTIVGILFKVHSELGGEFEEKYYQRAVETLLNKQHISYAKELKTDLFFNEENIGRFFLDFLIEEKVVLELKATSVLQPAHFRQVKSYLIAHKIRLGILANFRGKSLVYKRVLNSEGLA